MQNPGEELVGSYLREVLQCDFVEFNLRTKFAQGEIDVVGINSDKKIAYICEVTTHLAGLQYVNDDKPDNVRRLVEKFRKDIEYARKFLPNFECKFMFWSPIVKKPRSAKAKNNQSKDVENIKNLLKEKYNVDLQVIINSEYLKCIKKLRTVALQRTDEIKSPIMRFLQIEEKLVKHVKKLEEKHNKEQ